MPNGKGILQNLLHILRNLFCGEVIVLQYLVYVIAVEKLLLETEVQYLHVRIAVETRDLLSEAAVEYAVLEGVMTTSCSALRLSSRSVSTPVI